MASAVKLGISCLLCLLLLWGTYDHVFNLEPNKCEMTYMFEYPHFIPIKLPVNVKKLYPQYNLFAYGEGNYSQILRAGHYTGIPVLFIPGNGGSHKQVRSLASVAFRKALDDETDFHFDFFAVSFNNELAAFYGPLLERQTDFVNSALKQILKLYNDAPQKPKAVVLVGHSMGGMVARAVFLNPDITTSIVPLIITQATPHTRPVILVDQHLELFYDKVNDFWTKERSFNLKDVVLITIGGGRNDIQVATSHINTPLADISTTTSNVPSCWLTADHQAIVWCRQLVLAIVRGLFDCVDQKTGLFTTNRRKIINVFEYHLIKRIIGKRYKSSTYAASVRFDSPGEWIELPKRQSTHVAKNPSQKTFLMVPLQPGHQQYREATVVATNLSKKDWIAACTADRIHNKMKICSEGENLSNFTRKMHGRVKAVQLDLVPLGTAGYTHLVVYIPPDDDKEITVSVDVHSQNGRQKSIEVPTFLRSFTHTLVVDTTPLKALSYNVSLIGLQEPWQSLRFTLRPRSTCREQNLVVMAKVFMPWAQKESYLQKSGTVTSFSAELDYPPSPTDNSSASIQFILNPECTYTITLQGTLVGVFRRLIWLYGSQIPTYCAIQLFLALARQLRSLGETGRCPSFFSAMLSISPIAVVPASKILSLILRNLEIDDDFTVMSNNGEHLGLLPILLFLGSLPLMLAVGAVVWCLVLFFGNATHSFVTRIIGRSVGAGDMVAELAMSGLSRAPVVAGVVLISLAYSTCGTLALSLAGIFYFVKVFRFYEDYIEKLVLGFIPGTADEGPRNDRILSAINFHMTVMMVIFLVTVINTPALIIWVQLPKYNLQLSEDPTLMVAVGILITLCFLWQKKVPHTDKKYYKQLSYLLHFIAIMTLTFGSVHIYRVSQFVMSGLALVALHQVLSPIGPPHIQAEDEQNTQSEISRPYMHEVGSDGSATDNSHSVDTTPGDVSASDSDD